MLRIAINPTVAPRLAGLVLSLSISVEIAVLADVLAVDIVIYNLQHLFLMLALNWILYFGGQALFAMFPAFVLADDTGQNA